MGRKSIIWNISKICAYDCSICCVDAYYVSKKKNCIVIKTHGLENEIIFDPSDSNSLYEEANHHLKINGLELSFDEKLKVLENIDLPVEIDFSGGDPLLLGENLEVIKAAKRKFGKMNISVTTTGVGMSIVDLRYLSNIVGHIDFTYDFSGTNNVPNRPTFYNSVNLGEIKELKKLGIKTTAQIPLSKENIHSESINNIYTDLKDENVDEIVLMKILPVGRGVHITEPTREEYRVAIRQFKKLEKKFKAPKIKIQSILNEVNNHQVSVKEKHNISSSLNITNLGLLLWSPWAYNNKGQPLERYIVGDIKQRKLTELLEGIVDSSQDFRTI